MMEFMYNHPVLIGTIAGTLAGMIFVGIVTLINTILDSKERW